MYNQKDYEGIKKQLISAVILRIAFAIFFISISIILAIFTQKWLGLSFLILGVCIEIFIWGVYTSPIFSYFTFIRDLTEGRSRQITVSAGKMSEAPVYKDNRLYYYELVVKEEGIERILLLDNQKAWPDIDEGNLYDFQIHENFVINYKPITL